MGPGCFYCGDYVFLREFPAGQRKKGREWPGGGEKSAPLKKFEILQKKISTFRGSQTPLSIGSAEHAVQHRSGPVGAGVPSPAARRTKDLSLVGLSFTGFGSGIVVDFGCLEC